MGGAWAAGGGIAAAKGGDEGIGGCATPVTGANAT